ncbi:MAG: GNAT family N-acetyltransferase [Pseudomonadales bacterium]|nr:GNAT family N-acetyltransferase [Pseudomonadales bacterium]
MRWQQIEYGSPHYQAACTLRQDILRTPLGLTLDPEELALESAHWHFGLFTPESRLVACLCIVPLTVPLTAPLTKARVKLRQMAIAEEFQHQGLGRQLIAATEQFLRAKGIGSIELHARHSAVAFYHKLGYRETGPGFIEVGIPHQKMEKFFD